MYSLCLLGFLARKLIFLAFVGFLFVTLIGPFLAVFGVLASFALIGLVFWLPIRILLLGKPVRWEEVRERGQRYGGMVWSGCQRVGGRVRFRGPSPEALERVRDTGRFVAWIFKEMASGALVGLMLALFLIDEHHPFYVPLGMVIGSLAGATVALLSRPSARVAPANDLPGAGHAPQAGF